VAGPHRTPVCAGQAPLRMDALAGTGDQGAGKSRTDAVLDKLISKECRVQQSGGAAGYDPKHNPNLRFAPVWVVIASHAFPNCPITSI